MSAAAIPANASSIERFCNKAVDTFIFHTSQNSRVRAIAAYTIAALTIVITSLSLIGIPLVYRSIRLYIAKTIEAPLRQSMQTRMDQALAEKDGEMASLRRSLQTQMDQAIAEKNRQIASLQRSMQAQTDQALAKKNADMASLQNLQLSHDAQIQNSDRAVERIQAELATFRARIATPASVATTASISHKQTISGLQATLTATHSAGISSFLIGYLDVRSITTLLTTSKFFRQMTKQRLEHSGALSVRTYYARQIVLLDEQTTLGQMQNSSPMGLGMSRTSQGAVMRSMIDTFRVLLIDKRPVREQAMVRSFSTAQLASFLLLLTPPKPSNKTKGAEKTDPIAPMTRYIKEIQPITQSILMTALNSGLEESGLPPGLLGGGAAGDPANCPVQ